MKIAKRINKSGATQLFAPGSALNDSYKEYSHRQEYRYSFGWEARRPLSDFGGVPVSLFVTGNGVDANVSSQVWFQAREEVINGIPRATFEKMLYAEEAVRLEVSFRGVEQDFVAVVTDTAGVSDLVTTGFNLKLQKDKLINKTLFKGNMPSNLIEQQDHTFVLHLGQLPGVNRKDLENGTNIILNLTVGRSLNQFQAKKEFEKRYKIAK
jgi:hypothetical protein